jgi:hypothetical protein
VDAFLEIKKKKGKEQGEAEKEDKKWRRGGISGRQENSKITWSKEVKRQENGKDTRKAGGNENGNKRERGKENREVKREIERLKKEFKNREKKWEEEKRNGRKGKKQHVWESSTAGKENGKWRKQKKKNNIVITGWRGEGKSKQQIKEDIENLIKENIEEAKVKTATT